MPSLDQTACNHACFGTSCLIHIYSETFAEILKKLHCRCTELRHCLQDHTSMLICAFRQAADVCLDMHVCGTICTVRHHVYTRFSIPLHAAILYYQFIIVHIFILYIYTLYNIYTKYILYNTVRLYVYIYILYHHIHHVRPCDFLRSVTVTFLAETGRLQEGGHEATSLADSGALFCVPRHPNVVTFKHHGWMSLIIDHGSANSMTLQLIISNYYHSYQLLILLLILVISSKTIINHPYFDGLLLYALNNWGWFSNIITISQNWCKRKSAATRSIWGFEHSAFLQIFP